ncbi:hypothetical protein O181_131299 [Austropuccinia psidii MF-1]|uniref:Uncharacterized protein n=1 Tax=Austropuccinia psidii MF-1 TaxID=1389203 RepID=A0A9Q3L2N0_9BASI|nr:hypothetical protein [Austropuccinia psidii MF-1]
MPIISEPELELTMSNSNRYKSHSEGSDRHFHEPVQAVLHSVQRQGLGNVASNTPMSDELLAHPQKVPHKRDSCILQWMESTVIQASNQKDQGVLLQKEGGCHRGSWTEIQEWPGTQQSGNSLGRLQKIKNKNTKNEFL